MNDRLRKGTRTIYENVIVKKDRAPKERSNSAIQNDIIDEISIY